MRTNRDNKFIAAMDAEVGEAGRDFVYREEHGRHQSGKPTCVYVFNDKPSCLIGRALFRIGVPVEELRNHDEDTPYGVSASCVMDHLGGFSYKVGLAADYAQDVQDRGGTWGEALDKFHEYLTATGAVD